MGINPTKAGVDVRYPSVDVEDWVCWVMYTELLRMGSSGARE